MFLRLIVATILLSPVVALAHNEKEATITEQTMPKKAKGSRKLQAGPPRNAIEEADVKRCERLMSRGDLSYVDHTNFEFDLSANLGDARQSLGMFPSRTVDSVITASRQGIMPWGYAIAIMPSFEAARENDGKWENVSKFAYFIYDEMKVRNAIELAKIHAPDKVPALESQLINVSRLYEKDISPVERAEIFKQLFEREDVPLVQFSDKYEENGTVRLGAQYSQMKDVNKASLKRVMDFDKVAWVNDFRGQRFNFQVWTYPSIRGVVDYQDIFARKVLNAKAQQLGVIANKDIREALVFLLKFLKIGGTVTVNTDFKAAIEMARDQWRKNAEGNAVQNSRYKFDPTAVPIALKRFEMGGAFSVEARLQGHLLAGEIDLRTGDFVSGDTVFYLTEEQLKEKHPELLKLLQDVGFKDLSNLARAVGMASAMILNRGGIRYQDVGMVTPFTKQGGGKYWPSEKFTTDFVSVYATVPPSDLRFNEPLSLNELPYPKEKIAEWLGLSDPELLKFVIGN